MSEAVEREAKLKEVAEQSDSKSTAKDESSTSGNIANTDTVNEDHRSETAEIKDHAVENDADAEGDSEAETLIQSPEKKRNILDNAPSLPPPKPASASDSTSINATSTSDKENATRKRKRFITDVHDNPRSRESSRRSSSLSSAIAQETSDIDSDGGRHARRRQAGRHGLRRDTSESEDKLDFSKKRRRRPSEIIPPSPSHKRSKNSSIDATERRETRSATYPRPSEDEGSPSPEPPVRREHRRGASTQLTSHEFERKKRGRPPMIHTRRNRSVDRASVSSDGSEPTRRSRPALHKFTSDQDTMSPAKVGPRKWKDKNGRTYLARACANEDLEAAKARLVERPEDLNMEDNAGNTPLQIASLEGFVEIVGFLLSKGAEVNVRNLDKDTPLIDAVENGHVEVIKLLLENGANPRMGNAKGDEPYELVHPEDDSYSEIRRMLMNAKEKETKKHNLVDQVDPGNRDGASSRAASAASPRDSPPVGPRSPPAFGSRRRTGRSESTRNDLLWQANTQENLAKLAGKGDVQGVASILSILEKAETESLIAAAKAGHEEVLQLLIAMGKPDPDPEPVRSSKMGPGYNTPMLAAIGRGHPDVVGLLANQSGFNPMRRYRQKAYYELAQDRRGDKWEQEYKILKQAFDKYAISKGRKTSSPRKTRDVEKGDIRAHRKSSSPVSIKRQSASPSITHKALPPKSMEGPQKDKRKVSDPSIEKRKIASRQEAADSSVAVASDLDQTAASQKKTHRTRRSQSDLPPTQALETETAYKRKRLLTGKEHRSRQTNANSSDLEAEDLIEVKQEEKPGPVLKRTRSSVSPEPPSVDTEKNRVAIKKRRTVLESSPDDVRTGAKIPSLSGGAKESETRSQPGQSDLTSTAGQSVQSKTDLAPVAESIETDPSEPPQEETKPITTNPDPEVLPDAEPKADDQAAEAITAALAREEQDRAEAEAAQREAEIKAKEKEEAEKAAAAEAAAAAAAVAEAKRLEEERKAREAREAREAEEAEARRKAEEEAQARKKAEEDRQEQLRREMENRRRQQQLEEERRRVEALPVVLGRTAQMIDENDPEVKSTLWLNKYLPLYTVTTRQLDPHVNLTASNEEWIANFQAAGLLATKDLNLRSYTSFEKRIVSPHERKCLWRVARLKLSYDFNPMWNTSVSKAAEIEKQAEAKFTAMDDLFWVKLTDFMDQVSRFPHLTGVDLRKQPISLKSYNEILSAPSQVNGVITSPKALPNGVPDASVYGNGNTLP